MAIPFEGAPIRFVCLISQSEVREPNEDLGLTFTLCIWTSFTTPPPATGQALAPGRPASRAAVSCTTVAERICPTCSKAGTTRRIGQGHSSENGTALSSLYRHLPAKSSQFVTCRPTELAARIRAALRRRIDPADSPEPFALGSLVIDYAERTVSVAGRPVELSVNAGRVLSHEELLNRVWGMDHRGGMSAVRSSVKRLRGKLGDNASNPKYIFAVPRVGYRVPRGETPGRRRRNRGDVVHYSMASSRAGSSHEHAR